MVEIFDGPQFQPAHATTGILESYDKYENCMLRNP
jgi:small nuclear ribonucleoprotein (snRNP)-like protein